VIGPGGATACRLRARSLRPWPAPFLLATALLAGCQAETPQARAGEGAVAGAAGSAETVAADDAPSPSDTAPGQSAPTQLYAEVRRLNDACVQAGGGVSGSPDCDAGSVKEEELERLGFCIDYPNDAALVRCSDLKTSAPPPR
jgi:hypothetical protein